MRILVIDNTIDVTSWGSADLREQAVRAGGATVTVRRAPEADLPSSPQSFDRIIVSGSKTSCLARAPWISELESFVGAALDLGKPILGVCYGHQILARVLGGMDFVRKAARPEIGWTEIHKLGESPLLAGLPDTFTSFSSHHEEIAQLPPGARPLARSRDCAIQGFQLENRPVFGIQFHPEKSIAGAEEIFSHYRKKAPSVPLLGAGQSRRRYQASVGETIFRNFLSFGS